MTAEDSDRPNTNDSPEHRLEDWGNERQPSVDGGFANRLDSQLRHIASDRRPVRERRPIWQPIAFAAVALIAMTAGVIGLTRSGDDAVLLAMGATFETEIVLPNGEIVVGSEGLILADGTRISVSAVGSAVIGDVVLAPGTEALINNGRLEILGEQPPSTIGDPASTTRPAANDTTPTTRSDAPATSPVSRPSTTVGRTTTTAVSATDVSTTDASTTAAPTTASSTVDRPTSTPAPRLAAELTWVERDSQVQLDWNYIGQQTPAGWEVVATTGDQVRTLAVMRDPTAHSITVEALDTPVSYQVIARAADGSAIVESNVVDVP